MPPLARLPQLDADQRGLCPLSEERSVALHRLLCLSPCLRASVVDLILKQRNAMKLFAQLAKIDDARREVWGVATAEVVDK